MQVQDLLAPSVERPSVSLHISCGSGSLLLFMLYPLCTSSQVKFLLLCKDREINPNGKYLSKVKLRLLSFSYPNYHADRYFKEKCACLKLVLE